MPSSTLDRSCSTIRGRFSPLWLRAAIAIVVVLIACQPRTAWSQTQAAKHPNVLFIAIDTPEQRWSPLHDAKEAEYAPDELASKGTNPRHVVPSGVGGKEIVLPLNRLPSDRDPRSTAGESFDWGPFDVTDDEMGDGKITTWAVERLQRVGDRPFLLCVGYYRPHIPLYAPRRYFELYPESTTLLPRVLDSDLDDLGETGRRWAVLAVTAGAHKTVAAHGQWKAAVAAYLACVSFVDAQIGRLLDALDASPHRDNTVIALWGDHGWHLGEKQHWGKWTGWERATRVPLLTPASLRASHAPKHCPLRANRVMPDRGRTPARNPDAGGRVQ